MLGPGGYITKPRGEAHAMWNAGPEPARMIEVISPAGFELFFRDVVDATARFIGDGGINSPFRDSNAPIVRRPREDPD